MIKHSSKFFVETDQNRNCYGIEKRFDIADAYFLADLLEEPSNREIYTKYLIYIACLFAIEFIAILANLKKIMRSNIFQSIMNC